MESQSALLDKTVVVTFKKEVKFVCSEFTIKRVGVPIPPGVWIAFQRTEEDDLFGQWRLVPLSIEAWEWYGINVPEKKYGTCVRADHALIDVSVLKSAIWYNCPLNERVYCLQWDHKVLTLGRLSSLLPIFQKKLDKIGLSFYCG